MRAKYSMGSRRADPRPEPITLCSRVAWYSCDDGFVHSLHIVPAMRTVADHPRPQCPDVSIVLCHSQSFAATSSGLWRRWRSIPFMTSPVRERLAKSPNWCQFVVVATKISPLFVINRGKCVVYQASSTFGQDLSFLVNGRKTIHGAPLGVCTILTLRVCENRVEVLGTPVLVGGVEVKRQQGAIRALLRSSAIALLWRVEWVAVV